MKFLSDVKSKTTAWTDLFVIFGGVFLLFAASQVEIPLKPVPINLLTVGVMLIGLTYTPRRALESHLVWIALAAAGFPVLAGFSGGLDRLVGPTMGYIVGSVTAAVLMAMLKEKFSMNSWISDALLCCLGTIIVYSCGVAWLSQLIGFTNALMHGVVPFILPGFVKAGLLCTALQLIRHFRRG